MLGNLPLGPLGSWQGIHSCQLDCQNLRNVSLKSHMTSIVLYEDFAPDLTIVASALQQTGEWT